jgi:tetratricopeptide (TPR) repeat protein
MNPCEQTQKGFSAIQYMANNMAKSSVGPQLFVFDNFETVSNPVDIYKWIDSNIRTPNKVLITTRMRDFQGDYHIEVSGMEKDEFFELLTKTAAILNVRDFLTREYMDELFNDAEGHPYIGKVVLGEVAKEQRKVSISRFITSTDDILTSLFERTYANLSPTAVRVFLTLCNWRSSVPQLALEAILLRSIKEKIDVGAAVEELHKSSFIEIQYSEKDDQPIISVPLVTAIFGKKKLSVSPSINAIEADAEFLRIIMGGVMQKDATRNGIDYQINKIFKNIAEKYSNNYEELRSYLPMLEFIARKYFKAWVYLSQIYEESGRGERMKEAKEAVLQYLENMPKVDAEEQYQAWKTYEELCNKTKDWDGVLHSQAKIAEIDGMEYFLVSQAASAINAVMNLHKSEIIMDEFEKEIMIKKVIDALEKRISEATAMDYSRLAWLYINIKRQDKGKEYARKGYELDPNNEYCERLYKSYL